MPITKQVPLHGRRAYISPSNDLVSRGSVATGGEDKPTVIMPGSHDTVAIWDDFLGDLIGDEWAYVEGDTGYSNAIQTGTGGVTRITGSETNGVAPGSCAAITQGLSLQWKADMGAGAMTNERRLRLSARVKFDSVSRTAEGGRTHVFVGFADTGGAEFPAYDTGAGVISAAADLVGFMFSPGGDTGWSLVAAKSTAGDSGDQLVVAGSSYGPSANTYANLAVELRSGNSDTGGAAHFWINGVKVGRINSPVGSAVAMTPWIGTWEQDTGYAQTLDIDYVNVAGTRDSGM